MAPIPLPGGDIHDKTTDYRVTECIFLIFAQGLWVPVL